MKWQAASFNRQVYYRLIALWILCEAMLGGVIHALHIPVSGLVVGSCAIICVALIAYYAPAKGCIIKATIIVAIFKMMLSPQAPIMAYFAVFFQGALGELLFWNKRFYRLSCFLFAILALLESGVQRIIVLTIMYGTNLWKAVNNFLNDLTNQTGFTNYSLYIGIAYVTMHLLLGIAVGWWAGVIPVRVLKWSRQFSFSFASNENDAPIAVQQPKRRTKFRTGLLIMWVVLLLLYVQSYFRIGDPILPSKLAIHILIRSIIIVLTWYFVVVPLLEFLLKRWLEKRKEQSKKDIAEIIELLPSVKNIVTESWKLSASRKRIRRIILCCKLVLIKSLNPAHSKGKEKRLFMLTGGIQTGKTTSLIKWLENRRDVYGILTPIVNGKRMFMNVETKEQFPMEAGNDEKETLPIGKFNFSQRAFAKANEILKDAITKNGWLIIDEIGPLELKQQGFYHTIIDAIKHHPRQLIWVVREGLTDPVADFFELSQFTIITKEEME